VWRTHSWNPLHNAHHSQIVTVQYRWHPHAGLTVSVRQAAGENGEQLLCELADGTRIVIPRWMTEAAACAGLSEGGPLVSVASLCRLRELLDSLARAKVHTAISAINSSPYNRGEQP
jgi:hypothetical protein